MTGVPAFRLSPVRPGEGPALLDLWRASVRATHTFLRDGDLERLVPIVAATLAERTDLLCARGDWDQPLAFMGVRAGELEMLFVDPAHRGRGLGAALLTHAIQTLGVNRVDVNEQNGQAVGFYGRFGFSVAGRSPVDGLGLAYPILHMRLDGRAPLAHLEG
ncbi:MAG TPA: acetyltransferase [Geothrix sp.]|nr:acetyltransferase [Geothrix sp.]